MTRFDAADPTERQLLYADAIRAHRQRASPFLTIEAEVGDDATDDGGLSDDDRSMDDDATTDGETTTDEGESAPQPAPWVQFADGVVNLDCTETELDRLKDLLGQFPAFKIAELTRPEDAEGANVRVSAKADEKRIGEFVERTFRDVYSLDEDYRAWAAEV